ncbi:MAG: hypothetical protein GX815_11675, partial [Clostridiales bacterium]|nr:hypothetical protein [Clostridiales bacterium]
MKKMIFIITVATTFMFFGCQATPEKPIVIGKDLDKMIESAVREGVDTNPITEVNVAERYVKTIVNKKGNCTVNIDAELLVPEVDSIPIYRVSKQEFTKEMVDRLLKAFFDDRELYEVFSFQQKTKSQIQDEIIQLENELANLDPGSKSRYPVKNLEDIKSLDDLPEEVLKLGIGNDIILQLYINNLKEAYKTAPDNPPPPIPFAGEFRKMSDSVSDFRIMHAAPKPVDV